MAYLFDTDAISELWKPRPQAAYLEWIATVERTAQFTSAVVIGEMFKGAYRSTKQEMYLRVIEEKVLPQFTVLAYDVEVARVYGRVRATLEKSGDVLDEADLQIAATALRYGLEVVTGNIRHFERVPDLAVNRVLADARRQSD